MKALLVISSIVVPLVMLYVAQKSTKVKIVFNGLALLATIVFGGIAATSIYQIIVDDAVFMTSIHALFLNEVFLAASAYVGVFVIYRLMLLTWEER